MSDVILQINDTYKSFDNTKIHRGVSFDLNKGESIALLGGSGTGKSVLLRSIIGLEFIDKGEISFKNRRIDNLKEKDLCEIRKSISYSFQTGALFDSLNVFDNIAYPLIEHTELTFEQIKKKVCETLKLIDLENKESLMPSDLSGGMQKRVGMARSMIMNPDIILYDEPTAGLDPSNTTNIVNIMKKLNEKGMASIFVTHDIPSALSFCERFLILEEGKICFNGTKEEFQNSDNPTVKKFLLKEEKEQREKL